MCDVVPDGIYGTCLFFFITIILANYCENDKSDDKKYKQD